MDPTVDDRRCTVHIGVYVSGQHGLVAEYRLPAGLVDIGPAGATIPIPEWSGEPWRLVSGDALFLREGMRVNMCNDDGSARLVGTFEELASAGVTFPIPIARRRMTITLRHGIQLFVKWL